MLAYRWGTRWGTKWARSGDRYAARPLRPTLLLFYLQCPFHAWSLRFVAGLGAGEASSLATGVSVFALAFRATLPTTGAEGVLTKSGTLEPPLSSLRSVVARAKLVVLGLREGRACGQTAERGPRPRASPAPAVCPAHAAQRLSTRPAVFGVKLSQTLRQ